MRPLGVTASIAFLIASASVCVAQIPGFHPVGFPVDGYGSTVTGLSANGAIASGTAFLSSNNFAFTWTLGGGRNEFGREAGLPSSTGASAISGDGLAVVGDNGSRAFRYRGPGTYQAIAPVGGYTATAATGVNGDGSVVVGRLYVPQSFAIQAFRWTAQSGVQPLGYARPGDGISGVDAISRDGTTIVGSSSNGGSASVAYAWRQGTGMVPLPNLGASSYGDARGVNFDGSVIVGDSGQVSHAVMWRNDQVTDLGLPVGFAGSSHAYAVNDAGTVAVGYAYDGVLERAYVWTASFGAELLDGYLSRNGVSVPSGWTLLQATAVSADGLTIAGEERSFAGVHQGFVVTIPSPATLALLAFGALAPARRRR